MCSTVYGLKAKVSIGSISFRVHENNPALFYCQSELSMCFIKKEDSYSPGPYDMPVYSNTNYRLFQLSLNEEAFVYIWCMFLCVPDPQWLTMLVFDVIFDLGTHYNGRSVLKGAEKIPVQILRLFIVTWFFVTIYFHSRCCDKKSCGNRNETPSDPVIIDR